MTDFLAKFNVIMINSKNHLQKEHKMQALLQGLGRFLMRSFTTQAKPPEQKSYAPIRYASLMNIFQLSNTNIFDIQENVPLDDDNLQETIKILNELNTPTYKHLQDKKAQVTLMCEHMCTDGSHMTYLEYTVDNVEYATLLICSLALSKQQGVPSVPHFSMTGRISYDVEQGKVFEAQPEHTTYMTYQNARYERCTPKNQAGLQASILYANDAFVQLIAGENMKPEVNQLWFFDKTRIPLIQAYLLRIFSRTAASLEQELAARCAGQPTERQPQ